MINRAVIIGRLTSDVEIRKTQSGLSVTTFTVAVPDSRNKDTTNFINCVAWRQSADFLGQYSHKGDLVAVDGKINTRSYDRDGHKVYVTELVADEVQLLSSKAQNQQGDIAPVQRRESPQEAQDRFSSDDFLRGVNINPDDLPY